MSEEFGWLLEVALILIAAKLLEAIFVRIGLARLLAYLCVGVSLSILKHLTGYSLSDVSVALAHIGIIALLFRAGLESSLRQFLRSLREAGIIAVGGVAGALVAGLMLTPLIGADLESSFAMGVVLAATSISVTVKTLEELGALGSREAQAIIGAAVVDDVIGLALLSVLHGIACGGINILYIIGIPALAFGLWFGTAWASNTFAGKLFRTVLRLRLEMGIEALSFALVLLLAFIAHTIGLSSILLAYAFGLGVASFRYAARRIEEDTRVLTSLFSPLFFVYVGSRLDIEQILAVEIKGLIWIAVIVLVLGFASKILGCYAAARLTGFNSMQATIIGIGMVPRAEVALVAATMGLEMGLIDQSLFVATLLMVAVSLFTIPIFLTLLYRRLGRTSR